MLETYCCRGSEHQSRVQSAMIVWTSFELFVQVNTLGTLQESGVYHSQRWQLPCSWLCKHSITFEVRAE